MTMMFAQFAQAHGPDGPNGHFFQARMATGHADVGFHGARSLERIF